MSQVIGSSRNDCPIVGVSCLRNLGAAAIVDGHSVWAVANRGRRGKDGSGRKACILGVRVPGIRAGGLDCVAL